MYIERLECTPKREKRLFAKCAEDGVDTPDVDKSQHVDGTHTTILRKLKGKIFTVT